MSKNYIGVEDLLLDESFLSWYFRSDDRCIRRWEDWMDADPLHRERARQAVAFLQSLNVDEEALSAETVTQAESRLLAGIREAGTRASAEQPVQDAGDQSVPGGAVVRRITARRWWVAAASVLLVAAGLYTSRQLSLRPPPVLHTAYGEVASHQLPDGTSVVVNADSKLIFSPGWKDGKDREVWLTGEAFFHVAKTPLRSRFIVHVKHFDIIVTGTQFNVVNRGDKANVMLKEGSVTLQAEGGKEMKMKPGDFVEYRNSDWQKKPVKDDSVLAWKEHRLIFDGTPLRKLIGIIREDYGINVTTAGAAVEEKKLYGILPNNNLDVLLEALRATGDFDVVRDGDNILIKDKNQ